MTWMEKALVKEAYGDYESPWETSFWETAFWVTDNGEIIPAPVTHSETVELILRSRYGINPEDDDLDRKDWENISDMEWEVITGSVYDYTRAYELAIDKWNWIRVTGNDAEVRDAEPRTISRLANALFDVYGKKVADRMYGVEIRSRGGRTYTMNYVELMDGDVPMGKAGRP